MVCWDEWHVVSGKDAGDVLSGCVCYCILEVGYDGESASTTGATEAYLIRIIVP